MVESLKSGGKIISCGNGGSMCDAMHFAEELTGRYRDNRKAIPAISISDPSHIACVGNDYGFDYIFSRYLEAVGYKSDVLLGISTSGNILSTYERTNEENDNQLITSTIELKEQVIYGSERVGEYRANKVIKTLIDEGFTITEITGEEVTRKDTYTNTPVAIDFFGVTQEDQGQGLANISHHVPGSFALGQASPFDDFYKGVRGENPGENNALIEDDQGNILLHFSCYEGNLSLIFDASGSALASSESINATQTGKSLFAKVKETGSIYYLFTIGATGIPYYHVIDMALNGGLGELVSINNPIASQGGYLESMALIQDHTGVGITTLYLVHSTPTGFVDVLDLKAFNVQELGVTFKGSLGVINAAPESDCGLDISPDGSKLAINYGFFSQDYIHLYSLSPDHTPHDDFSYSVGFGDVSSSITFSPESEYLYFSQDFGNPLNPSQGIRRIALADGTVADIYNSLGEVITAENGKLYAYTADLTSNNELIEISSPDQTPVAQTISLDLQGTEAFLSGFPVQPHMVSKGKDRLKERVLRAKVYEISDHLGNVRSLIADVKLNESLAGGGMEQRAEILMSSDYYPFGMTIGETHVESEGYRYGFQGQEEDDELWGGAVSYKYRVEDPRLGRFFSVDPLAPDYPWNSPYAFSENRVIDSFELEGLERMDADGRIIYSNMTLQTFTGGLVRNSQWGGGNSNGPSFGRIPRGGKMVRVEWLHCGECQDQWSTGNQWFWRVQIPMTKMEILTASEIEISIPARVPLTPPVPANMNGNPVAGPRPASLRTSDKVTWSDNSSFFNSETMTLGEQKLQEIGESMAVNPDLVYQVTISTPNQLDDNVGVDANGNRTDYTGTTYADLLFARYTAVVEYITLLYPDIDRSMIIPNFQTGTNQDFSVEPFE